MKVARDEAERLGMPFLEYRDAQDREQIYLLEDTATRKIVMGRGADADICLSWDSEASSIHAELERIGGESWAVIDDGLSSNGTFVNGERIDGRRRLRDRDVLRLGRTEVLYRAPSGLDAKTIVAPASPQ